jgi:hypothetical protein
MIINTSMELSIQTFLFKISNFNMYDTGQLTFDGATGLVTPKNLPTLNK